MIINRLKEIREDNEMRQQDVADALGMVLGTYAMNETGHDTITLVNLVKFCDYFHVSVDYVFDFTNIENYSSSISNFDNKILSSRLKNWRKENKLTQVQVGKDLDIDHSVWCRYEQGKTTIQTTFLYTICKKYQVSADYLLGRIDSPKYLNK